MEKYKLKENEVALYVDQYNNFEKHRRGIRAIIPNAQKKHKALRFMASLRRRFDHTTSVAQFVYWRGAAVAKSNTDRGLFVLHDNDAKTVMDNPEAFGKLTSILEKQEDIYTKWVYFKPKILTRSPQPCLKIDGGEIYTGMDQGAMISSRTFIVGIMGPQTINNCKHITWVRGRNINIPELENPDNLPYYFIGKEINFDEMSQ